MTKKIGVFLSSKDNLPQPYQEAARQVGEWIGKKGYTLVYGGARKGLMETLAQSVKKSGGRIYGMVPDVLVQRSLVSDCIDVTFRCADLTDRKAMMNRESDVLVALPGGIGTLDEVFTVLANTCIGIKHQPVVFYNVNNCWDGIFAALNKLFDEGLVSGSPSDFYHVANNVDELEKIIG